MGKQSQTQCIRKASRASRLAVVLWNGNLGGAETLSIALAEHMHRLGASVTVVFVQSPLPLAKRLANSGIKHTCIGFTHGRDVLRHPRRYATGVTSAGRDGALLLECGFMGAALRAGGYRGAIVAVEHGALLGRERFSSRKRPVWKADRIAGAWADDAEVAVSDFMLEQLSHQPHARLIRRIYNGIDPDTYLPGFSVDGNGESLAVGFAGRLIDGKGADNLIRAIAEANKQVPIKLLIAGAGPERARLASLTRSLGIDSRIDFLGRVNDMPAFWRQCDAAAIPSDTFIESFSMVTLEAMTCGRPIIASRNGAIPELVVDGVTGTLVTPGDVEGLARALVTYAKEPELRRQLGAAARVRAIERFHIDDCASSYLDLFDELAMSRPARA
jgi:glycosyltransferase involved in cell wall biosynthesis